MADATGERSGRNSDEAVFTIEVSSAELDDCADIEVEPHPEIEAAWLEVAEERMRELDEGRAEEIPGEEVMAELRRIVSAPAPPRPNVRIGDVELTTSEVIDACLRLDTKDQLELASRYLEDAARRPEVDRRWLAENELWLARVKVAMRKASG